MPCPGGRSRVSGRAHPFCHGGRGYQPCGHFAYAADGMQPALVDIDGVATCPNKIHSIKVGDNPPECAPTFSSVGRNTGGAE